MSFTVAYNDNDQELTLVGSLTPQKIGELGELRAMFERALGIARGTLHVNVKRLKRLNNIAFRELLSLASKAFADEPQLKISVITSSMVGWSARKFDKLSLVNPNVTVVLYDANFYPGQEVLEDSGFIPVLRTQTKMTWRHEQAMLPRHGLREGARIADICCGIGDFAVLLHKHFQPSQIVAVDHSKPSLQYARKVASEFGIKGIEYIYGDASALLLDDDQFDFVTCRHSLQIFDKPEKILAELYRICRPGGRVYVTNEKFSHCLGEPRAASIQWSYTEMTKLFALYGMDLDLGPKNRRYLVEAGFEDIRAESYTVANTDGDPQGFADMIRSWQEALVDTDMQKKRGDSPEFTEQLRKGFEDHIFAALHPKGYAGWPIHVASGRKPA